MRVAIVYDSATGTTRAAAEQMAEEARAAGHACTVTAVQAADPGEVTASDAICIGSWTRGLYLILQSPTVATMDFIGRLGPLDGKPAAVFTTYKIAVGGMLAKMAAGMKSRGANVTGKFKSKGPHAAADFSEWLRTLGSSV